MKSLTQLVILVLPVFVFSQIPLSDKVIRQIESTFYENGKLSDSKIERYIDNLNERANQVEQSVYYYELKRKQKSDKKALKKSLKNKYSKSIKDLIFNWISNIPRNKSRPSTMRYLSQIIDIDNAIKIEITPYKSEKIVLDAIYNLSHRFKIQKHGVEEARNLINTKTGEYFSISELEVLKSQGVDISKFNPPKDNGVIELIDDISKSDVYDRYRNGNNRLHRGLKVEFPKENIGYFKEIRKTQSRPKIIFTTKDSNGNDLKEYKLKMNWEIHSEPTIAALGTAIGLYHDLSKHVKLFKIYIENMSHEEFKQDFLSYYLEEQLENIVHSYGEDTNGRYVLFKEGMLEARFDSNKLYRVGPYYPTEKKGLRESRGLMIFNFWVGNADLKPGENNKTLIKKGIKNELFYMQHDIGFGIGFFEREKPTDFPWNIIKRNKKKEIVFNFRSFASPKEYNHISFSDAKWMVRKIAMLTRKQIRTSVEMGQWPSQSPYNYEQLIIEKLIARRNDLVVNFNLVGEKQENGEVIQLIEYDKTIAKDALSTSNKLPGHTVDFSPAVKYKYLFPAFRSIKEGFVDILAGISRSISRIRIRPEWFGLNLGGVFTEVLLGMDKQIIPNPDAKHSMERFIVREDFQIGTRLGVGVTIEKDSSYVKKYSLIYPVGSIDQVDNHGKWIVDLSLPYRVMKNYLPKNHILLVESFIDARLRYQLEPLLTPVTPGLRSILSRVHLSRTIVGNLDKNKIKVFEDHSNYNDFQNQAYIRAIFPRIKFLKSSDQKGHRDRSIYHINRSEADIVDRIIMNQDFSDLKDLEPVQILKGDFLRKKRTFNLLGFIRKEKEFEQTDLTIIDFDENGKIKRRAHEIEGDFIKTSEWKLITNGEKRWKRATMSMEVQGDKIVNPYIKLKYTMIDFNAKANEIDNHVIPFFNGVARDNKFISFKAKDHSFTKFFGHINFHMKLKIFEKGIDKILNLTEVSWLRSVNQVLQGKKINDSQVNYFGKKYYIKELNTSAMLLLNKIKRGSKKYQKKAKIKKLLSALVSSIPRSGGSENPIFLASLLNIVGENNYHLKVEIESPSYQENKMPGRITPYNEKGSNKDYSKRERRTMRVTDALLLYNQFR